MTRGLLPDVDYRQRDSILRLPTVEDASVDFAMTFTVLQHMVDKHLRAVLGELGRVVRPGGFVMICEKVEPGDETERSDAPALFLSKHRPVAVYAEWMRPFILHFTRPRPAPASWKHNSGTAMLFRHTG